MRECHNCGHKDLPIWRHKRHRLYTDYCHITELESWDSALAQQIKLNHNIKINHYIYHYTKAGYIDRIHEDDSKDGTNWREPEQEKQFHFVPLNQTQLLSEVSFHAGKESSVETTQK